MTWALVTIAVLLIGYATVSRRLESLDVSGAMFFTTAGLLVGLLGFGGPGGARRAGEAAGRDHPDPGPVRRCVTHLSAGAAPRVRGAVRLLGIGLPLTIVAGAVIGAVVLPGVSFAEAVVLAIVLVCALTGLPERIDGIESVRFGSSSSPEGLEQGYDYAFLITFTDEHARDRYLPHPEHAPVSAMARQLSQQVLVFDITT